ncbi:TetR/AcrR family transcriptional regulator [Gottfriedia acidiceleris]|uniref:TetR/AcrR family transcriptional regulator n=1 Tax=Gottfriedia acidiceleris TaxID=371036 RepID=UPI003D202C92
MGSESAKSRYSDDETRSTLLYKLINPIKKTGIANMRTNDIAKHMDLSKATLYKYFESKDEIIKNFVHLFIKYYVEMDTTLVVSKVDYQSRFLVVFQKMLMLANFCSETFMQDLRMLYPNLWEEMEGELTKRNESLCSFYQKGMDEGIFICTNPKLIILQDEAFFSKLVDPLVLFSRNMTIRQTVIDYYYLRISQVFTPEFRLIDNNEETLKMLETMCQKITSSLHS